MKTGKSSQAEALLKELRARAHAKFGAEDSRTAKATQDLAMFYHRQGEPHRAEVMLRQCLDILERDEPPDSWKIANGRSLLGASLWGQGKYAEAELLLLRGYEGLKRHAGAEPHAEAPAMHPRLVHEALARIVRLYDAWDKPQEADKWRKLGDATKKDGKKKKKKF